MRTLADQRMVNQVQAAEYAGVTTRTIRYWISSGVLAGYRIGPRFIRIHLDDIDALITRMPATPRRRSAA